MQSPYTRRDHSRDYGYPEYHCKPKYQSGRHGIGF